MPVKWDHCCVQVVSIGVACAYIVSAVLHAVLLKRTAWAFRDHLFSGTLYFNVLTACAAAIVAVTASALKRGNARAHLPLWRYAIPGLFSALSSILLFSGMRLVDGSSAVVFLASAAAFDAVLRFVFVSASEPTSNYRATLRKMLGASMTLVAVLGLSLFHCLSTQEPSAFNTTVWWQDFVLVAACMVATLVRLSQRTLVYDHVRVLGVSSHRRMPVAHAEAMTALFAAVGTLLLLPVAALLGRPSAPFLNLDQDLLDGSACLLTAPSDARGGSTASVANPASSTDQEYSSTATDRVYTADCGGAGVFVFSLVCLIALHKQLYVILSRRCSPETVKLVQLMCIPLCYFAFVLPSRALGTLLPASVQLQLFPLLFMCLCLVGSALIGISGHTSLEHTQLDAEAEWRRTQQEAQLGMQLDMSGSGGGAAAGLLKLQWAVTEHDLDNADLLDDLGHDSEYADLR